jgi:hypothetical protein
MSYLGMTFLIATIFLTWNVPPDAYAQSAKTPKLTQAPVPPETAPAASKEQPYV